MRAQSHEAFILNSELHPSLLAASIFPFERAAMEDWADPSKSERSNSTELESWQLTNK